MRFLVHDRDASSRRAFDALFVDENIKLIRTPVQAPNANAHIERWVGSVRRPTLPRPGRSGALIPARTGLLTGSGYGGAPVTSRSASAPSWASAATAHLLRIDPRTHRVLARLRTSTGGPINYDYLTIGENAVWVVNNIIDAVLVSVDPATNHQTTTIALPDGPQGIASGLGSVWVSMFASAKVLRFSP